MTLRYPNEPADFPQIQGTADRGDGLGNASMGRPNSFVGQKFGERAFVSTSGDF